jgi:hypothetical protein
MQKTAQKRSLLNKIREMTNVSGIAAEKFFNPEFEDVMNRLRNETDDPVRAIVTGEQIGDAEAPADGMSLKALVSSAKSNVNRREYMRAVSDLGRFHKKMYDVVRILTGFKSNLEQVHEKFLFKDLDDESKQHLHDLKSRFTTASASTQPYFLKQANILDFFANIGTERGRALGAWEKRYPKQVGKLKKDTAVLLTQSEKLLSTVISVLKEMASARSVRNPDKYIMASTKILKAYEGYDKLFKDYYNSNVKGFLEKQQLIAPPKVDTGVQPSELGKQELAVEPKAPGALPTVPDLDLPSAKTEPKALESNIPIPLVQMKGPKTEPSPPPDMSQHEMVQIPPAPKLPSNLGPAVPVTISDTDTPPPPAAVTKSPAIPPPPMSQAHKKFYEALQKMSGESPVILSLFIKKYAASIQSASPTTALKLFKVARSIER